MLKRFKTLSVGVVMAIGVAGIVVPNAYGYGDSDTAAVAGSDGSGGGQVVAFSFEVTTTSASGGSDGGTTTTASSSGGASVRPACWYEPKKTGAEAAEEERRRATAKNPPEGGKLLFLDAPDKGDALAHAADNGQWYRMRCDASTEEGRARIKELMFSSKVWEWVPEGRAAPEPVVDPVTLARAAVEAAAIPAPSVETNPRITTDDGVEGAAVVGVDTWVWAASGTPSHVEVRATAGSTSVSVSADAGGLSLSAPRARTRCTGWGEPWREGTSREGDSDCVVVFTRSAAHVPLTVSATYDITWTSTNGTGGTLEALTTTTTIDLPVAEIQTINRPTPTH